MKEEMESLEEVFRKEVLKSLDDKISEKDKKALIEEAKTTLDFLDKIDEVELPSDNYVIFTDGKEQLLYENGEFFVISATDSLRQKVKKTKKQATDMYLDFFIKYQLNPILDLKGQNKEKEVQTPQKVKEAKKIEKNVEEKKLEDKKIELDIDEPTL